MFFSCKTLRTGLPVRRLADGFEGLFEVDVAGIEGFADDGPLDTELIQHGEVEQ